MELSDRPIAGRRHFVFSCRFVEVALAIRSVIAERLEDVDDGPTADQGATITNTGSEPVTITGVDVGGDAGEFVLFRAAVEGVRDGTMERSAAIADVAANYRRFIDVYEGA